MKAVIVGGTSGLGKALAAEFMAAGWTVAATGVREAAIKGFQAEYPAAINSAASALPRPEVPPTITAFIALIL